MDAQMMIHKGDTRCNEIETIGPCLSLVISEMCRGFTLDRTWNKLLSLCALSPRDLSLEAGWQEYLSGQTDLDAENDSSPEI